MVSLILIRLTCFERGLPCGAAVLCVTVVCSSVCRDEKLPVLLYHKKISPTLVPWPFKGAISIRGSTLDQPHSLVIG